MAAVSSGAVGAGTTGGALRFYEEGVTLTSDEAMGDQIAKIVLSRFRTALDHKKNTAIFQGKTITRLHREADLALEKTYTEAQKAALAEAFGYDVCRFYGLSAAKTTQIANWKSELVSADPGALVQIIPTPDPRLSEDSIAAVKLAVKRELVEKMVANGVGDPSLLISVENGRLHPAVKSFLDGKAGALKQIETARITSLAMGAAGKIQIKIRDAVVEGAFREAYDEFSFNQIKYGVGVLRFPHWERKVVLSSKQSGKGKPRRAWKMVPTFKAVSPHNFFPSPDGAAVQDCSSRIEYREINKMTLAGMTKDSRYDSDAIIDILEGFTGRSRNWLLFDSVETETTTGESTNSWDPEGTIGVLYHEGQMVGQDLLDQGLSGYEPLELYEVRAEICGGRAIRVEVINPLEELSCSYAVAKYDSKGPGVWNAVGVPAILYDTEERVNVMLCLYEDNLDWALRPPLMVNPEALNNPNEASNIRPGGKYKINELQGAGQVTDPIRAIRAASAQYQIVWPLVMQMIRQADAETGIPDLADMSSFGKGSLGELSARVSQAVRRVRSAAYSEDTAMKNIWQVLFEHVADENPEIMENADLDMNYMGILGLLAAESERKAKQERLGLIMQGAADGTVPSAVKTFAYQDLLQDYGVPTEALGFGNPLTDNAIALALQQGGIPGAGAGGNSGAPALDGRSGSITGVPSAVSAPNGGSALPVQA